MLRGVALQEFAHGHDHVQLFREWNLRTRRPPVATPDGRSSPSCTGTTPLTLLAVTEDHCVSGGDLRGSATLDCLLYWITTVAGHMTRPLQIVRICDMHAASTVALLGPSRAQWQVVVIHSPEHNELYTDIAGWTVYDSLPDSAGYDTECRPVVHSFVQADADPSQCCSPLSMIPTHMHYPTGLCAFRFDGLEVCCPFHLGHTQISFQKGIAQIDPDGKLWLPALLPELPEYRPPVILVLLIIHSACELHSETESLNAAQFVLCQDAILLGAVPTQQVKPRVVGTSPLASLLNTFQRMDDWTQPPEELTPLAFALIR